jgi:hypothetical protein
MKFYSTDRWNPECINAARAVFDRSRSLHTKQRAHLNHLTHLNHRIHLTHRAHRAHLNHTNRSREGKRPLHSIPSLHTKRTPSR